MALDFYNNIKSELQTLGFEVTDQDLNRPWGGFFYIKESQAQEFSDHFFGGLDVNMLKIDGKLSPKILMVKPNVKLSWHTTTAGLKFGRFTRAESGLFNLLQTLKLPWSPTDLEIK